MPWFVRLHLSTRHGYRLGVGEEVFEADYEGVGHGDLQNVRSDFSRIALDNFPKAAKHLLKREVLLRDIDMRFPELKQTFGSTPLHVDYSLATHKGREHTIKRLGRRYL